MAYLNREDIVALVITFLMKKKMGARNCLSAPVLGILGVSFILTFPAYL